MQVTFKCRFKSAASSANADSLCFHTWCITGTKGTRQHHVRGGPSSPFILWSPVFLLALASAYVIGVNPFIFGRNLGTIIPMYIYTISQQSRSEFLWIIMMTGSVGRDRHVASSTLSDQQIKTSAIAPNLPSVSFWVGCEQMRQLSEFFRVWSLYFSSVLSNQQKQ